MLYDMPFVVILSIIDADNDHVASGNCNPLHPFYNTGDKIKFPLGTVVKHKRYNFRGVVVAWDPYPKTDVSRWDGLQGIEEDVNELPFYHVITDTNDTVKAFGQERPFRYCCEENLEICPESELNMDVSIDEMDDWVIDDASDTLMYTPPDEVKVSQIMCWGVHCTYGAILYNGDYRFV